MGPQHDLGNGQLPKNLRLRVRWAEGAFADSFMPRVPVRELALKQVVKRLHQCRNRKRRGGLRAAGKTKCDNGLKREFGH